MSVPETAMSAAMAKALRAKRAAVPKPSVTTQKKPEAKDKEPESDELRDMIARSMR